MRDVSVISFTRNLPLLRISSPSLPSHTCYSHSPSSSSQWQLLPPSCSGLDPSSHSRLSSFSLPPTSSSSKKKSCCFYFENTFRIWTLLTIATTTALYKAMIWNMAMAWNCSCNGIWQWPLTDVLAWNMAVAYSWCPSSHCWPQKSVFNTARLLKI